MKLFVNHFFFFLNLTSGILFTLILTKYSRTAGSWELQGKPTEDTPQLLSAAQGKEGGHLQYTKQPPVAGQTPALPSKTKQ